MNFLRWNLAILFFVICLRAESGRVLQNFETNVYKSYPIHSILSAKWISRDSQTISLTFLSLYPNECYRLESSVGFTSTIERKIFVSQQVFVSDEICSMAVLEKIAHTTVMIPTLGVYEVVDALTAKRLGTLMLKENTFSFF